MPDQSRYQVRPDGTTIHYRLYQGGVKRPVLVLIHGMASNLTRWWEFVERTRLAGSWDLLRLDLRGHGESPFRGPVGMEIWCDDLAAILLAEGVERAVIGGHCLGANLAVFFAVRHPDRTNGLILIEPMPREAVSGSLKRIRPLGPIAAVAVRVIRAVNRLGVYRRRLPKLDLKTLDLMTIEAMAREGSHEAMMKRYASPLEDLRYLPSAIYLQDFLEVVRPLPPLSRVHIPALILLSTGGFLSDPEITQAALSALPRGRTVVLPARHWIPTERAQEMRDEIDRWCDALNRSSP